MLDTHVTSVLDYGIDIRHRPEDHPPGGGPREQPADGSSTRSFQEAEVLSVLRQPHGDDGQTMAEYAVVLGVITLAVVATLGLLNAAVINLLNGVTALL